MVLFYISIIVIFLAWQIGACSYALNEKDSVSHVPGSFWGNLFVGEIICLVIITFPIWIWFVKDIRD